MPVYHKKDDAVAGDKVVASARRISEMRVNSRTSKHKGQFIELKDNAFCVIETPFKWVLDKK